MGGSAGSEVTVSGSGFKPSGRCAIGAQAGLIIDAASCAVSSSGLLSASFKVSAGSTYGLGYIVTVTGPGGDSATGTFDVNARIVPSPNSGSAGLSVSVRGFGFTANAGSSSVTATPVGGGSTCSQAGDGTVAGQFSVASVPVGPYSVTVIDVAGAPPSASASFKVNSGPVVAVSPSAGPTGTTATVTGSGWDTLDTSVTFQVTAGGDLWDPPTTRTCSVSACIIVSGCSFTVKSAALEGIHTLAFTGTQGDSAQAQFLVTPRITMSLTSGPPGTVVSIAGSGFAAGDNTCTISSCPSGLMSNPVCTVSDGVVSGSFAVAPGPSIGVTYAVTVTGSPAGDSGSALFTVPSQVVYSSDIAREDSGLITVGFSVSSYPKQLPAWEEVSVTNLLNNPVNYIGHLVRVSR